MFYYIILQCHLKATFDLYIFCNSEYYLTMLIVDIANIHSVSNNLFRQLLNQIIIKREMKLSSILENQTKKK